MDDSVERIALFSSMATSRDSDGGGLLFCLFFYWQTGGGPQLKKRSTNFPFVANIFRLLRVC